MARVYLDTGFVSACVTTRGDTGSMRERRDPFIEEVRELKRAASAEFRHDLDALAEELRRLESRFPARIVDLSEGTRPQDKVA